VAELAAADNGLVVIRVHSPDFTYERDIDDVPRRRRGFLFRLICGFSNMGGSTIALVCGDLVNGIDQNPRTLQK
jgi:hypothetical protein